MAAEVKAVREAAAEQFRHERKQDQGHACQETLMAACPVHLQSAVCAPERSQVKSTVVRTHDGDHPLVGAAVLEGDEEDPLVLAEMESPLGEGNLLGARAEQERDESLALPRLERYEPLEHALEVGE